MRTNEHHECTCTECVEASELEALVARLEAEFLELDAAECPDCKHRAWCAECEVSP